MIAPKYEVDTLLVEGWALTTQGYIRGHWRIYHAQTWCVAIGIRLAEHGFKSEREAADWVNRVCGWQSPKEPS